MENYDIVYCVKQEENNDELRYSLRTLENLPHREVYIFGYIPSWTKNIIRRSMVQQGNNKWERTADSLWKIVNEKKLSDNFILFNDDFFVMNPQTNLPYYTDRTLEKRVSEFHSKGMLSSYTYRLQDAARALKERGKTTWNYELHLPMILNKEKLKALWDLYPNLGAKRSLYGNEYNVGGFKRQDCKIYQTYGRINPKIDFISTSDYSFKNGQVGREIRKKFCEKSQYEK